MDAVTASGNVSIDHFVPLFAQEQSLCIAANEVSDLDSAADVPQTSLKELQDDDDQVNDLDDTDTADEPQTSHEELNDDDNQSAPATADNVDASVDQPQTSLQKDDCVQRSQKRRRRHCHRRQRQFDVPDNQLTVDFVEHTDDDIRNVNNNSATQPLPKRRRHQKRRSQDAFNVLTFNDVPSVGAEATDCSESQRSASLESANEERNASCCSENIDLDDSFLATALNSQDVDECNVA